MTLGDRIRERRKAKGWSQSQLSEESGISQQMLSKLERGVAFGTTEIVSLACALKVIPRWLESGEGSMTGQEELPPTARMVIKEIELRTSTHELGEYELALLLNLVKSISSPRKEE